MVETLIPLLIFIVLPLLMLAGMWKTFAKAGEPGWAAIIPFYNLWVLVRISNNDWWWFILFFVPLVNIVAIVKILLDVSKAFGHGVGFMLGLWFLPFIFWPWLGFGDDQYQAAPA